MLHFTEQQVRDTLPVERAIEVLRDAFAELRAGRAVNQPRRRMVVPSGAVLHSMAGAYRGYFGTKIYATSRHGAHFLFILYSAADGRPLALFEANWLGQIRTGAASGLATDLLARRDASTLAVIGAGFQARSQVEAIRCVRDIKRARVWSQSEARRLEFAAEFGIEAAASAESAVRGADIVVTATNSRDPVIDAAWIAPGMHINAVGSNQASRRELPAEVVRAAALVVVDSIEQARMESGDLLMALDEDGWRRVVELTDAGARPADPNAITLFKSNGIGLEDVAAAAYIYERAAPALGG